MQFRNSRVEDFIFYRYRYGIGLTILIATTILMLTAALGNLVEGISDQEAISGLNNSALGNILENPVYFPYKLLQWLSINVFGNTAVALRAPSIIFGAASVFLLYDTFRHWHKQRIAILGSLFFVTSSWFLHFARLGIPSISMVFFVMSLLWAATRLHHAPLRRWPFLVMSIIVAIALYVPFMLYFLIAGVALHRYALKRYLWGLSAKEKLIGAGILSLVVAPLIVSFVREPQYLRDYLGIPSALPSISGYLQAVPDTLAHIFWRSTPNQIFHLSNLPMLDLFSATMTALGVYQYEKQLNQHRTKWLFIGSLILILAISISANAANFIILAPLVYIFAATGVVTLLLQWYEIFPKNPVARAVGLLPMILLLVVTTYYHGNRYYVAWARSPQTKAVFNNDTKSLRSEIKTIEDETITIVAPLSEHPTLNYSMNDFDKTINIITGEQFTNEKLDADRLYVHRDADVSDQLLKPLQLDGLITTDRANDSLSYSSFIVVDVESDTE